MFLHHHLHITQWMLTTMNLHALQFVLLLLQCPPPPRTAAVLVLTQNVSVLVPCILLSVFLAASLVFVELSVGAVLSVSSWKTSVRSQWTSTVFYYVKCSSWRTAPWHSKTIFGVFTMTCVYLNNWSLFVRNYDHINDVLRIRNAVQDMSRNVQININYSDRIEPESDSE